MACAPAYYLGGFEQSFGAFFALLVAESYQRVIVALGQFRLSSGLRDGHRGLVKIFPGQCPLGK